MANELALVLQPERARSTLVPAHIERRQVAGDCVGRSAMRPFVECMTIVVLCVSGLALGQSDARVLWHDGQLLQLRVPLQAPSLGEVLDSNGVVLDQADSVERFLAGILRPSSFGADEIHAMEVSWIGADPPSDSIRDPLQVDLVATIGSDTALVNIYVADGALHMAVTLYDQNGGAAFFRLQSDILEPIAVLEAVEDAPPVASYLIGPTYAMKCTCDDNKGVGGCTTTMCDNIETCPGKNGYSCAWNAMVLVPPEDLQREDRAPSGQMGP